MFEKDSLERIKIFLERHSPQRYSLILVFPVVALIFGFLIWNIYLYTIGFIENDLIRSRFVLTGIFFIALSLALRAIGLGLMNFLRRITKKKLLFSRIKIVKFFQVFIVIGFWPIFYSLAIFPKLPLIFGGGQPRALSFLVNKDNVGRLEDLEIELGDGSKFQTEVLCVAYENQNSLILLRKDRVFALEKSLIDGLVSLPGPIKSSAEEDCIKGAIGWSRQGARYSLYEFYNSLIADTLGLSRIKYPEVETPECAVL